MNNALAQIHLGLTSKCNLNCPHCYRRSLEKRFPYLRDSELTLRQAKSILKSAKCLGLFKVVLIYGEPLMYRHIYELIKWVLMNDLDLEIATNATLLDKKTIQKLYDLGLRKIHISLDYPDERHDKFRGKRGLFKHILKTLEMLRHYPIRVKIVSTMMRDDFESYRKLLEIADKYEVYSLYFIPPNPSDTERQEKYYKKLGSMLKNIHQLILNNDTETKIFIHDPLYPKISGNRLGWEPCLAGEILHIVPSGDVSMCPFSQKILGNVFCEPLEKVFQKNLASLKSHRKILNKECLSRLEKWGRL